MYTLAIYLYILAARLVALFNKKVRLMVRGQQETWRILQEKIGDEPHVWFHAASLGEFEQGRPLMERLRREFPEKKILLTFFSPSGFEVRKNYEGADVVCYLPFDTPCNAKRFIRLAKPEMVFFIKYEFWANYIDYLHRADIPTYSVSSIFRLDQIFFRWYGYNYARILRRLTHLFVQNEASSLLLKEELHVSHVSVVGDTRFDRVIDIRNAAQRLPLIATFAQNHFTLVCGSTWQADEAFILPFVNTHASCRLIIAPHVVNDEHIGQIERQLTVPHVRLSALNEANAQTAQVLIIDSYGLLSSLYAYGTVAYVGGGFGVGIHNVPEAAVYGIAVLIGPNNAKFAEAQALKAVGGVREVADAEGFVQQMTAYMNDPQALERDGKAAGNYINSNAGATDKIFRNVFYGMKI